MRRTRNYRSALSGMPNSGPSEAQVKIGWLQDRLRRTTTALVQIKSQATAAHARCADPELQEALRQIIDHAHQTLEAEAADARR